MSDSACTLEDLYKYLFGIDVNESLSPYTPSFDDNEQDIEDDDNDHISLDDSKPPENISMTENK